MTPTITNSKGLCELYECHEGVPDGTSSFISTRALIVEGVAYVGTLQIRAHEAS